MKSTGTIQAENGLWESPNEAATNLSGFTGLPGGLLNNGQFYNTGLNGNWWSSSESYAASAWCRYLYYNYGNTYRISSGKRLGFSVRCLKD